MSNIKYYDLPEEIIEICNDYANYAKLRELYTKVPFGFKKAVKCGKLAQQKTRLYWNNICELYPELQNKEIKFTNDNKIYIKTE
jgi:hypothetical protein